MYRANVALFYAASFANSGTSIRPVQQVAQERWHSLSENAQALALVNMAMNDSLVAAFLNKYLYNFWRTRNSDPCCATQTVIRKPDPDPSFCPLCHDSMFPELSLEPRQRS